MWKQRFRTAPTILVIEDYADSREMLRLLLENLDYRVITAETGKQALAIAANERIDLVLTDLGLPDINGVTLVSRLRRLNGQTRRIPIIMLTAFDSDEYRSAAIQAGCTGFLGKPPDFEKLQSMIERLLRKPAQKSTKPARYLDNKHGRPNLVTRGPG